MKSEASSSFWKAHDKLRDDIKHQAKIKYRLWKESPMHPGLQLNVLMLVKKYGL